LPEIGALRLRMLAKADIREDQVGKGEVWIRVLNWFVERFEQ